MTNNKYKDTVDIRVKDNYGNPVGFTISSAYNASSLFSDTVDLPTPGHIYVAAAGDLVLLLVGDTTELTWTFPQAGIYELKVKRIFSTGSDALTTYICN